MIVTESQARTSYETWIANLAWRRPRPSWDELSAVQQKPWLEVVRTILSSGETADAVWDKDTRIVHLERQLEAALRLIGLLATERSE